MRVATVLSSTRKKNWQTGFGLVALLLTTMILSACGDAPTPVPPTPTPTFEEQYQQDTNPQLFYTMNIPTGWTSAMVDPNTAVYSRPDDPNFKVGVISKSIDNLTPDDKTLLQTRISQVTAVYTGAQDAPSGGGTLSLVDTTSAVDRLSYTSNNVTLYQFVAQVNNVKANRAYLLYAISTVKDAANFQPIYFNCFNTFASTAPNVARGQSGVADPTVMAGNAGGIINPANPNITNGQYLRLVQWQSPPVDPNAKKPVLTGLFPLNYSWRLLPFPTEKQAALYLSSPVVDRNANQAIMQITIYKDAFKSGSPSADDWRTFYTSELNVLATEYLQDLGPNYQPINVTQVGNLYRVPFTATQSNGTVNSRGFIMFGHSGTNAIVGVVAISPASAVRQDLVDGFDHDFQTIINSIQVQY